MTDVRVNLAGSFVRFVPLTSTAKRWIDTHIDNRPPWVTDPVFALPDDAQKISDGMVRDGLALAEMES
jgi:hypothetical protein